MEEDETKQSLDRVVGKVNSGFGKAMQSRQFEQERQHQNNERIDNITAQALESAAKSLKDKQISMLESINKKQKIFLKGEKFRQMLINDKREKNKLKSQ